MLLDEKQIYCSYYTKSDPIVQYMVGSLELRPHMRALEPSSGDGVFIDALLDKEQITIDAYELNPNAVSQLNNKYGNNEQVEVFESDTLLDSVLDFKASMGGFYDVVIANPPYGAWQELEKRRLLKKIYPGFYVKETYSLFLYRCITLLKEGGQLTFIVPNTYLNLHRHRALRNFLFTNTKIKEIALFPSSFFPGVNFGYADLSIISLIRHSNVNECLTNEFAVIDGFKNVSELEKVHYDYDLLNKCRLSRFTQRQVFDNPDHALYIVDNPPISEVLSGRFSRLENVADCVTGFYSGDDKAFVRELSLGNSKQLKYDTIHHDEIRYNYLAIDDLLNGVSEEPYFLPMMKGGGIRFYKPSSHYINWNREAVNHYKKDKKARFQNSNYYFRQGIGIPMVSSSKISAALIDERIFDQGIVGVFPKEQKYLYYLLALFNSATCNKLIRTINPSANNSANYLKKLPILIPSEATLIKIDGLVKDILEKRLINVSSEEKENKLEKLIEGLYGF